MELWSGSPAATSWDNCRRAIKLCKFTQRVARLKNDPSRRLGQNSVHKGPQFDTYIYIHFMYLYVSLCIFMYLYVSLSIFMCFMTFLFYHVRLDLVDAFRHYNPEATEVYTYWSSRTLASN